MNQPEWKQLFSNKGKLVYEGYTLNDKPCGEGTAYYPDGKIYQEGIFDIKGLIKGTEYYPNGKIRFKGEYKINRGYGPNYPVGGTCYNKKGEPIHGGVHVERSGSGYPLIRWPEGCEKIPREKHPDIPVLMWEDKEDQTDTEK